MSDAPLGIGMVGAGAFGRFCLAAFARLDSVRIAAVADTAYERARELAAQYGAAAYHDVDTMLADPGVEIVHLSTPPALHIEQGMASLRAGKHLFCEKPLALTAADGQLLIETARANSLRLTVNYVMRHNPFWSAASNLARLGTLGALRHLDLANHAAGLSLAPDHWFWDKRLSGGIWIEHGVHFFDAFSWVSGARGEVIAARSYQRADDPGVTDRVEALLYYGDAAAHCYHAFDQSGQTEQTTVRLTFERGYLTLREWVPTSLDVLTTADPALWQFLLPGVVDVSRVSTGQFLATAHAPEGKSALYTRSIQRGMDDLAAAVRDPAQTLIVSGEDALASLETAIAAEKARTG
jgi:predicted dehydrogenase